MAEIQNLKKLMLKLDMKVADAIQAKEVAVLVGYTAAYAIYVHENMEIWPPGMRLKGLPRGQGLRRDPKTGVVYVPKSLLSTGKVSGKHRGFYWDPQGKAQPKFLEAPARELSNNGTFGAMICTALQRGKTIATALLLCGLRLQRESQQRVPVDTGNLKASAFTRLEIGGARTQEYTEGQGEE